MRLFLKYLRQHKAALIAFLLFGAIMTAFFFLYRLPLSAAVYPLLLCFSVGAVILLSDFFKVRKRHRTLEKLQALSAELIRGLPEACGIESKDYQRIISLLCEEQRQLRGQADMRYYDTVDYYTVWAHQIKTPIASMRLHLQNEDSALSRSLSSDLFRVEQYVEMVLTFLRLDSDTTDYVIKEYPLDPIIRQAIKKFSGEFIMRRLTLTYESVDASVVTDEKWLSFVIEQILSNALKYTRSGGIAITLEEPKLLRISDTGIGIAPEDIPRIFEKGYTGFNGRDDNRASGIGLYLCKRICDNLGAGISVESEPGRGTDVLLDLSRRDMTFE